MRNSKQDFKTTHHEYAPEECSRISVASKANRTLGTLDT